MKKICLNVLLFCFIKSFVMYFYCDADQVSCFLAQITGPALASLW